MTDRWVNRDAIEWVLYESGAAAEQRFTLLTVGSFTNIEGRGAYPARSLVSILSGRSVRKTERDLAELVKQGHLPPVPGEQVALLDELGQVAFCLAYRSAAQYRHERPGRVCAAPLYVGEGPDGEQREPLLRGGARLVQHPLDGVAVDPPVGHGITARPGGHGRPSAGRRASSTGRPSGVG